VFTNNTFDLKSKFLMEKHKLQKLETKIKLFGSSTSSKQKPNNIPYRWKNELSPEEKLTELQNKYKINVIPYFYVFK
jgi:hypothetical protein